MKPYCRASTKIVDVGLGQGGNVVLGLVDHVQVKKDTQLYFDNLFTTDSLLQELCRRKIGGTGTL